MMMARSVILRGGMLMARSTEDVSAVFQSSRVRIVTVRATNSLLIHLALREGTQLIDFVLDLSIRVVQIGLDGVGDEAIVKRRR
mgnify:CR=1 FL=1